MKRTIKIGIVSVLIFMLIPLLIVGVIYRGELLGHFHTEVGLSALKQENVENALHHLKKAVEANPFNWQANRNFCLWMRYFGKAEEVIQFYSELVKLYPGEPIFRYYLGWSLLIPRRYDAGVRELEKALELDPDYYPAYYGLGIYHTLMGEAEIAEEKFRKCRALAPDSYLSYLGLGYLNRCRRWDNEALKEFETARQKRPDDFQCYIRLFALYSSTGQRDAAIQAMEEALSLCPYLPHYNILQEQLKKYSSREIKQVSSLSPEQEERIREDERAIFSRWQRKVGEPVDPAAANLTLAKKIYGEFDIEKYLEEINRMAEDLEPAIRSLTLPREKIERINQYLFQEKKFTEPWIRGDPNDVFLNRVLERKQGNCVGLSYLYVSLGRRLNLPIYAVLAYRHIFCRYDDGRERINIETQARGEELPDSLYLLSLPPAWVERGIYLENATSKELVAVLLHNRGWVSMANKKYRDAIADYKEALNLTSNFGGPWFGMGLASYLTRNYGEAVDYFEAFLQLEPGYDTALYNLGKAYNRSWKTRLLAIQKFEEALAVTHNHFVSFKAYRELGRVYRRQRKYQKAIETYQTALRLKPDSISAQDGLAFTYRRFKKFDKARKIYQEILKRDPNNDRALFGLGMIYTDLEDHEAALPYFKQSVEAKPGVLYPHYQLGLCYVSLGDLEDATRQYTMIKDMEPQLAGKLFRAIKGKAKDGTGEKKDSRR